MEYVSRSHEETKRIARNFITDILKIGTKRERALVIALYGDLGVGKTYFTQAIGEALGITETIPSPTFIIERVYEINKPPFSKFVHIDAYRILTVRELSQIGWDEEVRNPNDIILVEWADKIENALPKDAIKIHFEHREESERVIKISSDNKNVKKSK